MRDFFAKRRVRKQLNEYISPELVRDALEGRALDMPKIHSGLIEFIFVFARAETAQQLAERVGRVADAGIEREAVVHNLIGPMVVMAFGTLRETQSSGSRQQLVSDLQQQFGADIKIVHGATDGHFGSFGNKNRLAFTFTFPHFDRALAALGRLEFGLTEELTP